MDIKSSVHMQSIFATPLLIVLIIAFMSATSVSNVNAADKEGPGYVCTHIPGSGTVGQVKCCSNVVGNGYCTICDNTTPPSNCQPRSMGKEDSSDSGPQKDIESSSSGTYHEEGDANNSKGIDPNNSGGVFNQ